MANFIVAYKGYKSDIYITTVNDRLFWKQALIIAIKEHVLEELKETAKHCIPLLNEDALIHIYEEILALPDDILEAKQVAKRNGWEFNVKETN